MGLSRLVSGRAPKRFKELSHVRLTKPVECEGRIVPEGSTGLVLDVSPSGERFEIEFIKPFHCVATVWLSHLT